MCTAVLSIEPGQPTLLIGVRDELVSRAWEPPARHWPERPGLVGGLDLQAGGTWLAVSPQDRRVGCVLNGRGKPAPIAARRSRGILPLQAAAGHVLDGAALDRAVLDEAVLAAFDPFHLLTAEPGRAVVRSWDGASLTERVLPPGLHLAVNSGWASGLPAQAAAGHPHEVGRISHFLPRFLAAGRPDPQPGLPVPAAWGDWFPLVNGDNLGPDDDRALIVRRDLGDGRIWGTTSISLVALSPAGLRYDFTSHPGDPGAWYPVL